MGFVYLFLLLAGIGCMVLIDYRFKLFFWHDPAIASLITALATSLFLVWDVFGIAEGVFLQGNATIASGIALAPDLPLEEPVFLIFLVLCTMVVFTGTMRILSPTGNDAHQEDDAHQEMDAS